MKFRKKPVVIEAVQWNGNNFDEVMNFMQTFHGSKFNYENAEERACKTQELQISTSEGLMTASKGDWIIKEPFPTTDRAFYPCKPDIFQKTYSPESESEPDGQEAIGFMEWYKEQEILTDGYLFYDMNSEDAFTATELYSKYKQENP